MEDLIINKPFAVGLNFQSSLIVANLNSSQECLVRKHAKEDPPGVQGRASLDRVGKVDQIFLRRTPETASAILFDVEPVVPRIAVRKNTDAAMTQLYAAPIIENGVEFA